MTFFVSESDWCVRNIDSYDFSVAIFVGHAPISAMLAQDKTVNSESFWSNDLSSPSLFKINRAALPCVWLMTPPLWYVIFGYFTKLDAVKTFHSTSLFVCDIFVLKKRRGNLMTW